MESNLFDHITTTTTTTTTTQNHITEPTQEEERPKGPAIKRQLSYNLQGSVRPSREGSTFDAFFVIGVDPSIVHKNQFQPVYPPSVLYKYPEDIDEKLFPSVYHFCFPHGIEAQLIKRTKSLSAENTVLYASIACLLEKNRSFVVMLTGEQHLYYGICVIDVEFVKTMPSFMDPDGGGYSFLNKPFQKPSTKLDSLMDQMGSLFVQNQHVLGSFGGLLRDTAKTHTNLTSRTAVVAPRCYLLISKFPFFQLHFDILYHLLANEHLFRITRDPSCAAHSRSILEIYKNTQVPMGVDIIDIRIPGEPEPITFACPPGNEDQLLIQYCMSCTFGLLNLKVIFKLISALLQEEQVIFISKNLSVLSAIVLSFIPLLRPFTWQGLFIPILPNCLAECIDAPVPFIIGVEEISSKSLRRLSALVFDIDQNRFIDTFKAPQVAEFPELDELLSRIGILHQFPFNDEERLKCLLYPYKATTSQKLESHKITTIINQWNLEKYHTNIQLVIEQSPTHSARGGLTFDIAKEDHVSHILDQLPSENRCFYQKLLLSQMYSFYFDKQLPRQISDAVIDTQRRMMSPVKKQ